MSKSKRFLWSLVYAVGMFPLGLVSSFLLSVAPVYCGVLMALNVALSLWLGPVSACIGAGAFCLGTALFTLAVDPNIWPIAAWLFVLTAGITVMIDVQLRRKTPLFYTMLNAGLTIVVFGALSYIALNFTVGDFVTLVGKKIGKGLESVAEASPQLYDLMLSTWSSMGVLPDVGLAGPVTALDAQTRKELTSSLLESFELSLRMNLIGMLVQSAMHMAVLGTLIPLMLRTRYGQGEEFTPLCNLETVRIPARLNLVLMLGVLVLWVLILVNDSFYAVYSAAWSLVQYIYIYGLQGLSVCEWFLKKHGWKKGWRYLLMGAGYVLLPTVLFLIGFLEQIFYFRKIGRPRPEDFGLKGPDDRDDDEM